MDVPTASAIGSPQPSTSTGTVSEPPPAPVMPINVAIRNPNSACMTRPRSPATERVDAALQFGAGPSARARLCGIERRSRARGAADAGVSGVVKRHVRDLVDADITLHLLPVPEGQ